MPGSGGTDFNITGDEGRGSGDREYVRRTRTKDFSDKEISYNLMSGVRLSYNYILEKGNFKFYDHGQRLTPDNNLEPFRKFVHKHFRDKPCCFFK